jgi:UDP-N-acetyl-2-amino-2-deoxyglucuronate dehydrogenase
MAAQYLSVYRDLDWVRVVSCVSRTEESAQRAADTFSGEKPRATTDFAAALGPDVDAVVINTPNSLHAAQAITAIRAGKHVLLQKPIAASVADAEAIARAAAESGKTVGVYMSYFDQPLIHEIRGMVQAGDLGEVVHLYARLMHRGGVMWSNEALAGKPNWRGSLAETGGGCFIQLAVHFIRTFEWMTNSRVTAATGMTNRLHSLGIEGEDIACAVLRLDSGALITLDMAWCADGEEITIHGTHGRIHYRANRWLAVSSKKSKSLVEAFGGPIGAEELSEFIPPAVGDASNPLNQHRMFLEAARDGRPAYVSIADGVHDMKVVEAVYESARTGRVVEIP